MKIQYCSNGRIQSDNFKTGTISNYRVGLKTIEILMDRWLCENVL